MKKKSKSDTLENSVTPAENQVVIGEAAAETEPVNEQSTGDQLVDGLSMWSAELPENSTVAVELIRLGRDERLVIPFTTSMARVQVHFLESEIHRGYLRCNDRGCILCRVGRNPEVRDLLPLYDPINRTVGVCAISPNIRPQALRPQLEPILRRVAAGESPFLVSIIRVGMAQFDVRTSPLAEGADDGSAAIHRFQKSLENGLQITRVFSLMDNQGLSEIPEIQNAMSAKGLSA